MFLFPISGNPKQMSRLWKLKNADGITMLLVRGCWGPGAGASKGPLGSPVLAALALGFCKFLRGASEPESCRGWGGAVERGRR